MTAAREVGGKAPQQGLKEITEGPCLPRPETHGIQFKTERVEMGRETRERQDSVGADQGLSLPDPLILKLDPFKL